MAKYKKKLDDNTRCPLEYGLILFGSKSRILFNGKGKICGNTDFSNKSNLADKDFVLKSDV